MLRSVPLVFRRAALNYVNRFRKEAAAYTQQQQQQHQNQNVRSIISAYGGPLQLSNNWSWFLQSWQDSSSTSSTTSNSTKVPRASSSSSSSSSSLHEFLASGGGNYRLLETKPKKRAVALLIDGDQAKPDELLGVVEFFEALDYDVAVRKSYFRCKTVATGPKWTRGLEECGGEAVVVRQYGRESKELVDKVLAHDAVYYGLKRRMSVAVVSRDKGFAYTYQFLTEKKAPQCFAITDVDGNEELFSEQGAVCVPDRGPLFIDTKRRQKFRSRSV